MADRGSPLPRRFFARDSREVAPDLLNKVLVRGRRTARIVEVEAYVGAEDPASHAYRGETPRTRTMFGPAGHLYVYFSYGMHWCANAVCGEAGEGTAVLLRAAMPLAGLEEMWTARPKARKEIDLCSGPAKLCQAFGIDRTFDGADLVTGDHEIAIHDDGTPPPDQPVVGRRIGITVAVEHPWRWHVPENPHVSRPR